MAKKRKKTEQTVTFNPKPPEIIRNYDNFDTLGSIGQKKFAGVFYEEFIRDLNGRRGIETYKEMSENDDVIGSIVYAIEMLIRHVKWDVNPSGTTDADMEAAEFVRGCMDDMSVTWADTMSDILSFIIYGWSWVEICYKVRKSKQKRLALSSKYNDGLIGWAKLPIRAQDTLYRWEYDEYDDLVGMTQMVPPDGRKLTIPLEKSMHFVTKSTKGNPEGRSVLRSAYRSWYFKKRLQEIEGVGIERDLAGLPMMIPPEGLDIWDPEDPDMVNLLRMSEDLVRNIRRDEKEGIVLPPGWSFQLLNSGSRRQFEIGSVIERYDKRIATTVMADFILLGQQSVGSFALADSKAKLFSLSLESYLNTITEVFNTQGIPRLIDLNGAHFKDITDYPKLVHGDIEQRDAVAYLGALEKVINLGLIQPDENLADYTRQVLGLPEDIQGAGFPQDPDAIELTQDPVTGMLVESESGALVDPNTGGTFNPQTGEPLADPETGEPIIIDLNEDARIVGEGEMNQNDAKAEVNPNMNGPETVINEEKKADEKFGDKKQESELTKSVKKHGKRKNKKWLGIG